MDPSSNMIGMLRRGNLKQVKATSNAMQKENSAVEKKIAILKGKMIKEKEERERMGGPRWKSSQKFNKGTEKPKLPKKNIKMLSDKPLDYYKKERNPPPTIDSKLCGQCDERKAKVECNECAELYCADCYKHFHSRGALRKHTWKSLDQASLKARLKHLTDSVHSKSAPAKNDVGSNPLEIKQDNARNKVISVNGYSVSSKSPPYRGQQISNTSSARIHDDEKRSYSGVLKQPRSHDVSSSRHDIGYKQSLLQGEYNEDESAASFSEALNEWRRTAASCSQKSSERGSSATSTQCTCIAADRSSSPGNNVKVDFSGSPSLSYLDRIIVKKYKKNPHGVINVKYPSPPLYPPSLYRSRKSTSPTQNKHNSTENGKTPSPCVLSLNYSIPTKVLNKSSAIIEIQPCDSDNGERSPYEYRTSPVISYEGSESDVKLNCSPSPTSATSAIELVNVSPSPVLERPAPRRDDDVALPYISKGTSITENNSKNASRDLESSGNDMRWRPPPRYLSMENYFLLGSNEEKYIDSQEFSCNNDNGTSINGTKELLVTCKYEWRPDCSILKVYDDESKSENIDAENDTAIPSPTQLIKLPPGFSFQNYVASSREISNLDDAQTCSNIPVANVIAPTPLATQYYLYESSDDEKVIDAVPATNPRKASNNMIYDYIQALPPQSKGDDYDKIHRASTSLSISALPIDIWADSDISLPVSRRSSNLPPSLPISRQISSSVEKVPEQIQEMTNDELTNMNFSQFDLLAEEVIAMRTDFSCHSKDEICDGEKVATYDADSLCIEDNDAGSGLSSSAESDV